jgi:hypothetical protein
MNIVSEAISAGLNVGRLPPIDFVHSIEITQVLSISCSCLHVVSLTPDKMDSSLVSPIECIYLCLSVSIRYVISHAGMKPASNSPCPDVHTGRQRLVWHQSPSTSEFVLRPALSRTLVLHIQDPA